MNDKHRDATWLFERARKSEAWWTALFSILLLHLHKKGELRKLMIWSYSRDDIGWRFQRSGSSLPIVRVRFDDLLIERTLSRDVFPGLSWPDQLICAPDISIVDPEQRSALLLENKTVGANPGRLELYVEAVNHLRRSGWQSACALLISAGHPNEQIWNAVVRQRIDLILWEDVLKEVDEVDFLRGLVDEPLKPYYERPILSGKL